jgi:hypothetical protein
MGGGGQRLWTRQRTEHMRVQGPRTSPFRNLLTIPECVLIFASFRQKIAARSSTTERAWRMAT